MGLKFGVRQSFDDWRTMFAQLKRESLRKLQAMEDKSPKGCIDEPIVEMIRTINAHPDYVSLVLVESGERVLPYSLVWVL